MMKKIEVYIEGEEQPRTFWTDQGHFQKRNGFIRIRNKTKDGRYISLLRINADIVREIVEEKND